MDITNLCVKVLENQEDVKWKIFTVKRVNLPLSSNHCNFMSKIVQVQPMGNRVVAIWNRY